MNAPNLHRLLHRTLPHRLVQNAEGHVRNPVEPGRRYCGFCGEQTLGDTIAIRVGMVEYRPFGPVMMYDTYPDDSDVKFFHPECIKQCEPSGLDDGVCELCGEQFFLEESVLEILQGTLGYGGEFTGHTGGNIHFACGCDKWDLPVWRYE